MNKTSNNFKPKEPRPDLKVIIQSSHHRRDHSDISRTRTNATALITHSGKDGFFPEASRNNDFKLRTLSVFEPHKTTSVFTQNQDHQ